MFETGIRQLRLATAIATGRPLNPRNVERLVADAVSTLAMFGAPGQEAGELIDGPFADPAIRREIQEQALRRTAKHLASRSPFYRRRFADAGIGARALTLDDLPRVPPTTKADLVASGREFVLDGARPYLATRTTGSTGRPVEVWLSRYEVELWPALAALSGLIRDEIRPSDCLQINISSRATAAMQQNITLCRLVGARSRALGLVPPEEALDGLLSGGSQAPTLLATYPSYLALLVDVARQSGLAKEAFRLRRIDCGGEVLSDSLIEAASATFGAAINDTFAMTEVLPVTGRVCESGHLHHDLNMGLVEVCDMDSGEPAAVNGLGTVVVTPYFPYRECMPVFRYDTRDVVRVLDPAALDCSLAGVPATSRILGKANQILRVADTAITTRDLVEACEALPGNAGPARYAVSMHGPMITLEIPASSTGEGSAAQVSSQLRARLGAEAMQIRIVDRPPAAVRRVRADLLEQTFTEVTV